MDLTKARLAWVELYAKTGDAGLVCRRCGISQATLRTWWHRYQTGSQAGPVEHSRRAEGRPEAPHAASRMRSTSFGSCSMILR
jgi:transposase-like protein